MMTSPQGGEVEDKGINSSESGSGGEEEEEEHKQPFIWFNPLSNVNTMMTSPQGGEVVDKGINSSESGSGGEEEEEEHKQPPRNYYFSSESDEDEKVEGGPIQESDILVGNDQGVASITLEKINPPDPTYQRPKLEDEMGLLQQFFDDQLKLDPKMKQQYILVVIGTLFEINPHDFEPYKSYAVFANDSKTRRKFKSLKATKDILILELRRRKANFKANKKNSAVAKLILELQADNFQLVDGRDIDFIKCQERELRKVRFCELDTNDRLGVA